jgi:hypothetical protein
MIAVVMISLGFSSLGMAAPVDFSSASFLVKENFAYPVVEPIRGSQLENEDRGLSLSQGMSERLNSFVTPIELGVPHATFRLIDNSVSGGGISGSFYPGETHIRGEFSMLPFKHIKSYLPLLVNDVEPDLVSLQSAPFITRYDHNLSNSLPLLTYGKEVILGRVEPVMQEFVRLLPDADGELRIMNMLIYDMPTHHVTGTELAQLLLFSLVMLLVWPETKKRRFPIWLPR